MLKYGLFFFYRFSQRRSYLRNTWFIGCVCFSQYFCCGKKKVFLLRRPIDGSSEALQRSQNPLSSSLLSFSFSHLCVKLCTATPQIWAWLIQTSAFFLSHLSLLDRLASTSEVLLHLCLSLCPGMAAEVLSNAQYFHPIIVFFLSSVEGLWILYHYKIISMKRGKKSRK